MRRAFTAARAAGAARGRARRPPVERRQSLELVSSLMRRVDAAAGAARARRRAPTIAWRRVIEGLVRDRARGLQPREPAAAAAGAPRRERRRRAGVRRSPAARGGQSVLLARDGRRAARARHASSSRGPGRPERSSAASEGGPHAAQSLPSTLEQLIADRSERAAARRARIVDWLAVAGGPLARRRSRRARRARGGRGRDAAVRARPVRRAGGRGRRAPPAHARRGLPGARAPAARAHAPRSASTSPRRRSPRASAPRSSRATSRAAATREKAGTFYLEAANAARGELPAPARHALLHRALAVLPESNTRAPRTRTKRSRRSAASRAAGANGART